MNYNNEVKKAFEFEDKVRKHCKKYYPNVTKVELNIDISKDYMRVCLYIWQNKDIVASAYNGRDKLEVIYDRVKEYYSNK